MAIEMIKGSDIATKTQEGVKILNFFADWCGPCKMFAPILEDVSNDVPVFKINIDEDKETAIKMDIQSIPATFIYKDGKVVDQVVGFLPKEHLLQRLKGI